MAFGGRIAVVDAEEKSANKAPTNLYYDAIKLSI